MWVQRNNKKNIQKEQIKLKCSEALAFLHFLGSGKNSYLNQTITSPLTLHGIISRVTTERTIKERITSNLMERRKLNNKKRFDFSKIKKVSEEI